MAVVEDEKPCGSDDLAGLGHAQLSKQLGLAWISTLQTEQGKSHMVRSDEPAMQELIRPAWVNRYLIEAFAHTKKPDLPVSVILRRAPRER